jgi:hypothetical protein
MGHKMEPYSFPDRTSRSNYRPLVRQDWKDIQDSIKVTMLFRQFR